MTAPAQQLDPAARRLRSARRALAFYRFMAFFTGVMLLILTFVAIPLQVWGGSDTMVEIFGAIHGYGYIVYLIAVANLALKLRWSLLRLLLVAVAGTVPFCSFIAERQIMARIRRDRPDLAGPTGR